jgi:fucose permease
VATNHSSSSPSGRPSEDAGVHDADILNSEYWLARRNQLFIASCIALIVTAMNFAIRGDIMNDLGTQFDFSKNQLGAIAGIAFLGFTLAMVFGGPLCDVVGMGRLLYLAMAGHAAGIVITIMAGSYTAFWIGALLIGLGNGLVEAACNPLIATLYPDQKIKRLNQFHMWFPGGIAIGGLLSYAITQSGMAANVSWKVKMATMLVPLVIYAAMFVGKKFPATERAASNVTTAEMFKACLQPFFLLFVFCMLLTAAVELVTGQWMPDILSATTGVSGILFLVLSTGLMTLGRGSAGVVVHRISPVMMLLVSSILSIAGLFLLSRANGLASGLLAIVVFSAGVCFFWPTMLGVVSDRFPRTGAVGLAIMGGAGNLSVAAILPIVGSAYDRGIATAVEKTGAPSLDALKASAVAPGATAEVKSQLAGALAYGGQQALQVMLILPVILTAVFAAIYLYDKARGGYRQEVLVQHHNEAAETAA